MPQSRRDLIQITMAALAAAPAALGQEHAHDKPDAPPAPAAPKFFRPAEMTLLGQVVERIIPRSDTPGALDARVPHFIDRAAHGNAKLAAQLRRDLRWIGRQGFGKADTARQDALLTAWSAKKGTEPYRIFQTLKDLTIDGYYGSREGLVLELGWHGNTFLREFPGCTEPEHGA